MEKDIENYIPDIVNNSETPINQMNVMNSMLNRKDIETVISNQQLADSFYTNSSNLPTNMLDEMTLYLINNRTSHVHVEHYTSQSHMKYILDNEYIKNGPDYLKNNLKTDLHTNEVVYVNKLKTKNFNFERYDATTNSITYENTPGVDIDVYRVVKPDIYSVSEKSNPSSLFTKDRKIVNSVASNTDDTSNYIKDDNNVSSYLFEIPSNIYNWYMALGLPYQIFYGIIAISIIYVSCRLVFPSKNVIPIDSISRSDIINDNIPVIIDITVDPLYYDIMYNPLYEVIVNNNAYFIQWIMAFSIYYI